MRETQRMVCRKRWEVFIQTNSVCKCPRKKYSTAFSWFPRPCCGVLPLVLCVAAASSV